MQLILLIPFLVQGSAMFVDEFYFHHGRGLGKWEKFGHPLDTITVLACFAFCMFAESNMNNLLWFAALALFSCLFVTKDEWVHTKECCAAENWLHAVLFVMHPIVFVSAGLMWWFHLPGSEVVLTGQVAALALFLVYQIVYWNFMRRAQDTAKQ